MPWSVNYKHDIPSKRWGVRPSFRAQSTRMATNHTRSCAYITTRPIKLIAKRTNRPVFVNAHNAVMDIIGFTEQQGVGADWSPWRKNNMSTMSALDTTGNGPPKAHMTMAKRNGFWRRRGLGLYIPGCLYKYTIQQTNGPAANANSTLFQSYRGLRVLSSL